MWGSLAPQVARGDWCMDPAWELPNAHGRTPQGLRWVGNCAPDRWDLMTQRNQFRDADHGGVASYRRVGGHSARLPSFLSLQVHWEAVFESTLRTMSISPRVFEKINEELEQGNINFLVRSKVPIMVCLPLREACLLCTLQTRSPCTGVGPRAA